GRHTSFSRDWSADVCSSDLLAPGATERLGLGSASLRQRFPRLIVCDIGGFAPGTPDYTRKAYDLLLQAEAGLSSVTGSVTSGPKRGRAWCRGGGSVGRARGA